jgi:hypothetical protein
MTRTAGNVVVALGLAALVGGMVFFGAIVAPLVFTQLPPDIAGPFIRTVFPCYYGYIIVSAGTGAVGFLLRRQMVSAVALLVVVAVTVWLWFWLIPHLNALREAGDMAGFGRGHRFSVYVNGAELITALWLLVRTAI